MRRLPFQYPNRALKNAGRLLQAGNSKGRQFVGHTINTHTNGGDPFVNLCSITDILLWQSGSMTHVADYNLCLVKGLICGDLHRTVRTGEIN